MRMSLLTLCLLSALIPVRAEQALNVYFIDVEGGQSTLFVSPSGQSMLVDTGWTGNNGRDASRIMEVAKLAGIHQIDDLGDLTWNKELDLVCPNNKIGTVDVYLSTHHGMNLSNCPAIVHALHPWVAVMNNGATKGGSPEAWQTIHTSPGLRDIWQLHYAEAGGKSHNTVEPYIANVGSESDGHYIKLTAFPDGTFTVINSRNGKSKTYKGHPK
ncbi:MAG: hypothetical protein ACRD2O_08195 [Terriglobia bacterium]